MPYNNLIYLLLVILILVTRGAPEEAQLPALAALGLFLAKGLLFAGLCHRAFRRPGPRSSAAYFRAEQRFSILAVISLAADVYLLDAHYYLVQLPGAVALPALVHLAGVGLFLTYLAILWDRARPAYGQVFEAAPRPLPFLVANLKFNLVILLPWMLINLLADLLALSEFTPVRRLLASPWGEPLLILAFFLLLLLIFPLLATRLWGCTPLPDTPLRRRLEEFCRRQGVKFRDIMLWPLFEGRLLTAGVMGLTGRFRHLLITPALIKALTVEELEAVVAHEIGHVKHHHLPLYLLFFLGFGLFANLASTPFLVLLLDSALLETLVLLSGKSPLTIIGLLGTVALVLLIVLYFRFLFGFFMRNFERQADLYALATVGDAGPLVRVFEKIAWLGGKIRDLPSWHHFSIGQRIDFLEASQRAPRLASRHHRKVRLALILFLLLLSTTAALLWRLPPELSEERAHGRLVESIIMEKIRTEPDNPAWLRYLGDLYYLRGQHREAVRAYEHALGLDRDQPDILNNLAWLLLTTDDLALFNPERALPLAQRAMRLLPEPHIIDTLATAWWLLGERDQAVALAEKALAGNPRERQYYQEQLHKFRYQPPPGPSGKRRTES